MLLCLLLRQLLRQLFLRLLQLSAPHAAFAASGGSLPLAATAAREFLAASPAAHYECLAAAADLEQAVHRVELAAP